MVSARVQLLWSCLLAGACAGSPLQISRMEPQQIQRIEDVPLCNAADNLPRDILNDEIKRRGLDCWKTLIQDGLVPKRFVRGNRFIGTWYTDARSSGRPRTYKVTSIGDRFQIDSRVQGEETMSRAYATVSGDTLTMAGAPRSFYKGEVPRIYILASGNLFFTSGADDFVLYSNDSARVSPRSILGSWQDRGATIILDAVSGWSPESATLILTYATAARGERSFSISRKGEVWVDLQSRFEVRLQNDGELVVASKEIVKDADGRVLIPSGSFIFWRRRATK